ncbi:HAD-IIIC family phosphatase [Paenibacillus amylolyticus]|uniref:HAD-IIIC family phosphatase n=1 Tax=Paenibacillus amylolyticus TaxID=1451 RepID=UPI003EB890FA
MSSTINSVFSSFADIISYRAKVQPDSIAYTFIDDNGRSPMTYQELEARVRRIASSLLMEVKPGDRVLILQQPGLEYICSFFACQYAKVIAVPAYPPLTKRYSNRVLQIAKDSGAKVALSSEKWASKINAAFQGTGLINMTTDRIDDTKSLISEWVPGGIEREDTAFLQYTSGSTGNPKGVMISHQNLLHNSQVIQDAFNSGQDSVGMVWLPPYHDMGLIGGILQPLYTGFPIYLMAPNDFIESPIKWLETISELQVTISGGPNFAYDLCLKKISDDLLSPLDLSHWKVAFTGAEPIQASILKQFAERFAPCGFKFESFLPCYGMAESTLYVTGGHLDDSSKMLYANRENLKKGKFSATEPDHPQTVPLVSCGVSYESQSLLIVDPESSLICSEGEIGEVCVRSESVAKGYYNEEHVMPMFEDRMNVKNEGAFYKTGDLGFLHKNELYITGRLKDLIIIRGQNYYPSDIEFTMESLDKAFVSMGCAAFATTTEATEGLVIVQELSRQYREESTNPLANKMREALSSHFGIKAHSIIFIKQGSLPKTSSGKVMRSACKELFESQQLKVIQSHIEQEVDLFSKHTTDKQGLTKEKLQSLDDTDRQEYIGERLQHLLMQSGVQTTHLERSLPLSSLGLDSIEMISFRSLIESEFGVRLDIETLFSEELSIHGLIHIVMSSELTLIDVDIPLQDVSQFELSEDQKRLWFVESISDFKLQVPVVFEIKGNLNIPRLQKSWEKLLRRHGTFRTVFHMEDDVVFQEVSDEENMACSFTHHRVESDDLERMLVHEASKPFDLQKAPLTRITVFERESNEFTLLFVSHHLIADLKSMFIAMNDLLQIYSSPEQEVQLPRSIAFTDYLSWDKERMKRVDLENQAHYWKEHLKNAPLLLELPVDYERPEIRNFKGKQHTFQISAELSDRMRIFCKEQGVTPYVTMLTAFATMLQLFSSQNDLVIGTPLDRRSSPQFEKAIGFFAQPMPLRIVVEEDTVFQILLQRIRKTVLSALSNQDISFSKIVEMVNPVRSIHHNPIFQVMFSYLKVDMADCSSSSLSVQPVAYSECETEFDLFVTLTENVAGELVGSFGYNAALFAQETIKELSELFINILEKGMDNPTLKFQGDGVSLLKRIHERKQSISNIVIASTFTSDMVEESIVYWNKKMKYSAHVKFAPSHQVFLQLLDPSSFLSSNPNGVNVLLVRISDLLTGTRRSKFSVEESDQLQQNVEELIQAIRRFSSHNPLPLITCICPESPEIIAENSELFAHLEGLLESQIADLKYVHNLSSNQIKNGLDIETYYDEYADNTAQIPYSYSFFCVIGTSICRKISSLSEPMHKVIILDCDNTLWQGVCAEDGAEGIVLDERSLGLQRFVVEQYKQGMIICLCSKNNEEDVWNVFETREDMILKKSHITAYRINWASKPNNIVDLSQELSLSLDSFVFFDDNPVECTNVELEIPEVQTIQVNDERYGSFSKLIDRLWLFDRATITHEDLNRTKLYQENRARERFLTHLVEDENAYNFATFLDELHVEINVESVSEEHISRVSQLTFRTNQFNFTGIRQTEREILSQMGRDETRYFAVSVRDRFGDYGLVGVLCCEIVEDHYYVKNWLLSCRVLGRGVEYKILEAIGEKASEEGAAALVIEFTRTGKNTPALIFVNSIANDPSINDSHDLQSIELTIEEAMAVARKGVQMDASKNVEGIEGDKNKRKKNLKFEKDHTQLTMELMNIDALALAIQKSRSLSHIERFVTEYVAPRNLIEEKLAEIWSELLKVDRISVYDNFFFLGGHSLMSHQIILRIREEFHIELPPSIMFSTDFTIASLAEAMESILSEQPDEAELAELVQELENLSEEELQELLNKVL